MFTWPVPLGTVSLSEANESGGPVLGTLIPRGAMGAPVSGLWRGLGLKNEPADMPPRWLEKYKHVCFPVIIIYFQIVQLVHDWRRKTGRNLVPGQSGRHEKRVVGRQPGVTIAGWWSCRRKGRQVGGWTHVGRAETGRRCMGHGVWWSERGIAAVLKHLVDIGKLTQRWIDET